MAIKGGPGGMATVAILAAPSRSRFSMSLLRSLVKNLKQQAAGRRTWTPAEVRELIDRKAFDEARQALDHLPVELEDREAVRESLLGEVLFQLRDDEGALRAFQSALRLMPGMPSAHYGLSLLMAEAGELEDALRHAFFADSVEPTEPRFAAQVGYCQLKLKNFVLAEVPLRRATLRSAGNAHVWNNLGLVLISKGKHDEGRECLERAVRLDPNLVVASANLGQMKEFSENQLVAPSFEYEPTLLVNEVPRQSALWPVRQLEREGKMQEAISACENLILTSPQDSTLALEANRLYLRVGDPNSGSDVLQAHFSRHPDDHDVGAALGLARLASGQDRAAEVLLRAAVEAQPDNVDRIRSLAESLSRQGKYAEAGLWLERAQEHDPNSLLMRRARAVNLINQCRYDEGLALCKALEAEGYYVPTVATVLAFMGRFAEADLAFDKLIERYPNDPHIQFHKATMQLLRLDFAKGWEGYKYRTFDNGGSFRMLPLPLWKGEPLKGRKILILAEQGLGDQVMFASCLPDLLALEPASVVVEAVDRIAATIQRSFPEVTVVATNQGRKLEWIKAYPDIDCYLPLGDLPRFFRSSLASFPQHNGYLKPLPERVAYWRSKLVETGQGPYIGFSWKGGVESTRSTLRSIDALDFQLLASSLTGTWVCLQYGQVGDEVAELRANGFEAAYWPEAIADLDEFAALVAALDLVVTVCNTTVHYAGAAGRPVWVLAPKVPEWRYGLSNRVLPWYPSSRMFRQQEGGDWIGVLEQVRQELSTWNWVMR